MAEEISGAFQITKEVIYFQLSDGRRFSLTVGGDGLSITDISWNRHFMGEDKSLTREAILATESSAIKCEDGTVRKLFDFMDNAPIPHPGKKSG